MRRLSGREEFTFWAGRNGLNISETEELLACASRLHSLATQECNGFRDMAHEKRATAAFGNARKRLDDALASTPFSAYSSDGWLTVRLCGERHAHESCTGRAVPR